MENLLVSIVIVNYENRDNLRNCLKSVASLSYKPYEVIVVDNGSKTEKIDSIKKEFPFIKVITNKKNLGFPPSADKGARIAKGKYVFFLNDDAIIKKNSLKILLQSATLPKFFAVQANLRQEKTNFLESEGFIFTWFGFFIYPNRFTRRFSKGGSVKEIFGGTGGGLLVERELFIKVGGFDTNFFLYQDDADICWRARKMGYKVYFEPKAKIIHQISATTGKMDHSFVMYNSYRSRLRMLLKNLTFPYILVILPLHFLSLMGVFLLNCLLGKFSNALAIVNAVVSTFKNMISILKDREKIQKSATVKESVIFSEFPIVFPFGTLLHFGIEQITKW